jgi:predicted nucleic acid-binding protein
MQWELEIANGFAAAIRRTRIDITFRDSAISQLAVLPIRTGPATDSHAWPSTLQLADRFQQIPWDVGYLELAQRRNLPLSTLDRALWSATRALAATIPGKDP